MGLRLAVPNARCVLYVEIEAVAIALLVAHMQDGSLDEAPIWSDLRTLDGRPWRGLVDGIIGGIPCQPWSVAGKRRGADDDRNLWPDALRVIREIGPRIVFIENVGGIVRDGYERLIKPDLIEAGYKPTAGIFTAAEVGASHRRERLFIMAHRERAEWRSDIEHEQLPDERIEAAGRLGSGSGGMGDSERSRWPQTRARAGQHAGAQLEAGSRAVGDPNGEGRPSGQPERDREWSSEAPSPAMGESEVEGLQGWTGSTGTPLARSGQDGRSLPAFPPGPSERKRWAAILAEYPELAPATQSAVRDVADGVAAGPFSERASSPHRPPMRGERS